MQTDGTGSTPEDSAPGRSEASASGIPENAAAPAGIVGAPEVVAAPATFTEPMSDPIRGQSPQGGELRDEARTWWTDLWRPEPLALTAIIATAAALFGFPFLDLSLTSVLAVDGQRSRGWQHAPTLLTALLGLSTGIVALQTGARRRAATWVKTLAGASVLVSAAATVGTVVIWAFAPHLPAGGFIPDINTPGGINLPSSCQTITGNEIPPECLPFPGLPPPTP